MTVIDLPSKAERRAEAQRLLGGLKDPWVATRMGVSKATVGLWHRGQRTPDLENLLRLSMATGRMLDQGIYDRIEKFFRHRPDTDAPGKDQRAV